MNLLITSSHVQRLPLLPLTNLVFFPNTVLPLHLSDPEAVALARYCLVHDWPLGVVTVRSDRPRGASGRSPLHEVGSIGHIVARQELDDGGLNITLQGIARMQILEELPEDGLPYRRARVALVSDYVTGDRIALEAQLASVRSALTALARRDPSVAQIISEPLMRTRAAGVVADALAAMIFPDLEERQSLLACHRVHERLDRVLMRLSEMLAASSASRLRTRAGGSDLGPN